MESHPINQHYVPRVLLKNFSSKKSHVWVYDKQSKKKEWSFIKERPISKVASEQYFYDKIPNTKEGSYEYELGKLEREIEPIISKIIESKDISILTEKERERFSLFIALQHLRTKSGLNKLKRITEDLEDKINHFFAESNNFDYRGLWFEMMETAPKFSKYISNKIWFLGESEKLFYCSDHPVVLQNSSVQDSLRGTLGLDSYGIEIYMPISDSLILCMFCEKLLQFTEKKTPLLDYHNRDYLLNANSLQIQQSERFIFSSRNNFEMVEECM